MMHGHEKADLVIVAMKPANKARKPTAEASAGANAAESVERRAGAKGIRTSTTRTGPRARPACRRLSVYVTFAVTHPRWEPYAEKPHVRFWAGRAMNARPYRSTARSHSFLF